MNPIPSTNKTTQQQPPSFTHSDRRRARCGADLLGRPSVQPSLGSCSTSPLLASKPPNCSTSSPSSSSPPSSSARASVSGCGCTCDSCLCLFAKRGRARLDSNPRPGDGAEAVGRSSLVTPCSISCNRLLREIAIARCASSGTPPGEACVSRGALSRREGHAPFR